jgi:catechol 2,3-dioxygenase-like lactoylglutathione lyase family enzyme
MTRKIDRIVIAVPDLPSALDHYQRLFGVTPYSTAGNGGQRTAWLGLPNTVIELVQSAEEAACVQGLVFSTPAASASKRIIANALGIDIRLCDGSATANFRRLRPESQCTNLCVDHVVLRTDDAQGCIDLFAGELEVRLALDKNVPEWGGRMLFFRVGKMTLEVIESTGHSADGSAFWGLAYQCQNLEDTAATLAQRGVKVSDLREGRKPGTLVATVKSHCLGIPTLLIQPAK